MVINQIVAELRYIQKEPKITNFASSTTLRFDTALWISHGESPTSYPLNVKCSVTLATST